MSDTDGRQRITHLEPRGRLYRVRISGIEEPIVVGLELVEKFRLKAGIVVGREQVETLRREAQLAACHRSVAGMLARRDHSVKECRTKLRQKQFPAELIEQTVGRFLERGLLDDSHFALVYARSLLERNPAGPAFLKAALLKKGIDGQLAGTTVERLLADRDETDIAVAALRRRWSLYSQFELERARTKAYTYLSRRGIGYEAAKTAFERLYHEQQED